jgi:hypothetical protein
MERSACAADRSGKDAVRGHRRVVLMRMKMRMVVSRRPLGANEIDRAKQSSIGMYELFKCLIRLVGWLDSYCTAQRGGGLGRARSTVGGVYRSLLVVCRDKGPRRWFSARGAVHMEDTET